MERSQSLVFARMIPALESMIVIPNLKVIFLLLMCGPGSFQGAGSIHKHMPPQFLESPMLFVDSWDQASQAMLSLWTDKAALRRRQQELMAWFDVYMSKLVRGVEEVSVEDVPVLVLSKSRQLALRVCQAAILAKFSAHKKLRCKRGGRSELSCPCCLNVGS